MRRLFTIAGFGSRLACSALVLAVTACGLRDSSEIVVAKVGDRKISADEFAFTYELAPRSLTSQAPEQARRAVLQRLADIILLADEAERLGLADDQRLDRILDFHMRQAANRELYLRHVRQAVTIDEVEEREAYRRLKTKLFVKHFEAPSYDEAQQLAGGPLQSEHVPVHPWIETVDLPGHGQVDQISWNDIDATIEDILFALSPGQFSEPLFFGNRYHVYQLVEKETEIMMRENDFLTHRESLRGVIRKRSESLVSAAFIQDVMGPEQLIIKADALNRFTRFLWQNRPQNQRQEVQFITNEQIDNITDQNQEVPGLPMAEFRSGRLLVSDILFMYKLNPQKISYDSESILRENLKNIIAMYVRDQVLSEQALAEGLHKQPGVVEEIRSQREKLLADRLRRELYLDLISAGTDSAQLTTNYLTVTNDLINNLRAETEIEINLENLMAVNTTDDGLSRKIDFIAIRTQ
ncbi:MAG: SurA N-terminal domain-containing protein [Candidatus Marinimicrobia bacterium]|nr:SurA N-terminal domain-containing protein [Candidatus Neomarinimicrobiota bacterium]